MIFFKSRIKFSILNYQFSIIISIFAPLFKGKAQNFKIQGV